MKKHLNVVMRSAAVVLGCLFLYGCSDYLGNSNQLHVVKKETDGPFTPQQTVAMSLPKCQRDWHTIHTYVFHDGSVTMIAPDAQTKENWSESIRSTTILYRDQPGVTADRLIQEQVHDAVADCRDVHTRILQRTREYVIYRAESSNCAILQGEQVHYGKAFNGSDGVYGVLYSAKVGQVPQNRINYMAGVIKCSRLIRNPQ